MPKRKPKFFGKSRKEKEIRKIFWELKKQELKKFWEQFLTTVFIVVLICIGVVIQIYLTYYGMKAIDLSFRTSFSAFQNRAYVDIEDKEYISFKDGFFNISLKETELSLKKQKELYQKNKTKFKEYIIKKYYSNDGYRFSVWLIGTIIELLIIIVIKLSYDWIMENWEEAIKIYNSERRKK